MKTKLLSAFVLLFMCITANAYDVMVDSVYYNLNLTDQTATVADPSTENVTAYYKVRLSFLQVSLTRAGRSPLWVLLIRPLAVVIV